MKTPERIAQFSRPTALLIAAAIAFVPIVACSMAQAAPVSQELVQQGAYLARVGDCVACHTAPEGRPFAGGLPMNTPIGIIYSTNITPDPETGIGRYTLDDFVKAMQEGIANDGQRLYPAMPYTSFSRVLPDDLSALYTYFMRGVEPVRNPNRPTQLSWPLNMRSLLAVWDVFFLKKGEYAANPDKSPLWNRGAYLVQGLGHCGDCHTPRGIAGQVKADSEQDGRSFLAGATLDNWHASPLRGDPDTGLCAWTNDDIVEFLRTGRTARVAAIGVMAEVVGKSTQYLTDQDLRAIAAYLKSLPASNSEGEGSADSLMAATDTSAATFALRAGDTGMRGALVYLDNCNACHRSAGSGAERTLPNLVKNEAVNAKEPVSLIHIVLTGSNMPSTQTAPSAIAMPDFGWRLSDEEVADVLSFIRDNWGNHGGAVSSDEVGRVRKSLAILKSELE